MFIIIFPLLGLLLLLFSFVGIFFIAQRRERAPEIEQGEVQHDLFSIPTFDGRKMYQEIVKATNDFYPMYCIGKGGHRSFFKVEMPLGSIAVKKLHQSDIDMENQKDFLNEIQAMTDIKHRNIVKLFYFCSHPRHKCLVYEYLKRGSLAIILSREEEDKKLDWGTRVNIIKGVAHALSYMHHDCSPSIIHRDISSNNILLDSQYEAHIFDFDTAKLLKLDSSNQTTLADTYGYVAPGIHAS